MARILLVDDDETVGKVFRLGLTGTGIDVITCAGEDALAVALRDQPDVAVVDVMMPEVDGPEVCRQLRGHPATTRMPIVLISAKDACELKRIAAQSGAAKYLTKPFSPRELFGLVREFLQRNAAVTA